MQFTLSQSYQEYQGVYDIYICVCVCVCVCIFTNNLIMPKIYHSRDAREMFPYNSNCFIFILFNNFGISNNDPHVFLAREKSEKKNSQENAMGF